MQLTVELANILYVLYILHMLYILCILQNIVYTVHAVHTVRTYRTYSAEVRAYKHIHSYCLHSYDTVYRIVLRPYPVRPLCSGGRQPVGGPFPQGPQRVAPGPFMMQASPLRALLACGPALAVRAPLPSRRQPILQGRTKDSLSPTIAIASAVCF